MAGELDEIGIMTGISRVSKKHFVFYVNGEAVRSFRNRQSCNLRIEKLFEKNKQINELQPCEGGAFNHKI